MRLGEVLGLNWSDVDFAGKQINLWRQLRYINQRGYFFTTLKTESSNRYVVVDDILLGALNLWHNRQIENEKSIGGSYVYRESDGHIVRQLKTLPAPNSEKVPPVCTRDDGRLVLKNHFTKLPVAKGLNTHSFRHTHNTTKLQEETAAIFAKSLQTK